jgi:gas vesicle protein
MNNTKKMIGAVALAAAAAYLFAGNRGKENREKVKDWMTDAKNDVLDELRALREISQEQYDEVVDRVVEDYKDLKDVVPGELKEFKKELKDHWQAIVDHLDRDIEDEPKKKRA